MRIVAEAPEWSGRGADGGDAVSEAMLASKIPPTKMECGRMQDAVDPGIG
jgi:hypothetical protein